MSKRYPNGVPVRFIYDGARLKRDIDRRGLTIAEVAAAADISRQSVYNFIGGRYHSKAVLGKLAKALGYPRTRYIARVGK
jgi:transcriptional regulator with XRE-family HTH domain